MTADTFREHLRCAPFEQDGGVPIQHISVVAKDLGDHRRLHGFAIACDTAKPAVVAGLWLGGIFGICVGAAFSGFLPLARSWSRARWHRRWLVDLKVLSPVQG